MITKQVLPPIAERSSRSILPEWDEVHRAIQSSLREMDATIAGKCADVLVVPGRNASGAWELFSYRVYRSASGSHIDPVVVGITCAKHDGEFKIHGDIAGENAGDVLFDLPDQTVGAAKLVDAAREIARGLVAKADTVASAIVDPARPSD